MSLIRRLELQTYSRESFDNVIVLEFHLNKKVEQTNSRVSIWATCNAACKFFTFKFVIIN